MFQNSVYFYHFLSVFFFFFADLRKRALFKRPKRKNAILGHVNRLTVELFIKGAGFVHVTVSCNLQQHKGAKSLEKSTKISKIKISTKQLLFESVKCTVINCTIYRRIRNSVDSVVGRCLYFSLM